jgi:hypothetical protein
MQELPVVAGAWKIGVTAVSRRELDSMAKNEAEGKVLDKVREVEREQGSFAQAGSEPPPHFGHGSAKSAGVAGNKMPGGKQGG